MSYNAILDVQVITDLTAEPVTLAEVKQHLLMEFYDQSDVPTYTFSDDDNYLNALISQCRDAIERYCGLSMGVKTLRAVIHNGLGGTELPYGPFISAVSVVDGNGDVVSSDDYKIYAGNLINPCTATVEYTAGYVVVPPSLKRALLEEISWRYNHRGDEEGISEPAKKLAKRYRRIGWLL